MSSLFELGLGVYEKIPDFRNACPLCRGPGCAVRHGLYFRGVVDRDGRVYDRFPIPRFYCRRQGPRRSPHVTFSVLPAELVSRRRFSLSLMIWIVERLLVGRYSVGEILNRLAERFQAAPQPLLVEPATVYRILALWSGVYQRLHSFPLVQVALSPGLGKPRRRAGAVLHQVHTLAGRSPPQDLVLEFHRQYFPHLLFDLRLGR